MVATIDTIPTTSVGTMVMFKSRFSFEYPAKVMQASANTRARVPASVDSKPPLKVPLANLDDITLDRSARLTPTET